MESSPYKLPSASINCAKALAMLFVIMQHIGDRANFPRFYENFIHFTDQYNMPVFAFLSGYLAYYSYQRHAVSPGWDGVWSLIKRRAKQLLIPYAVAQLIYLAIFAGRNFLQHRALVHPEVWKNLLLYPIQTPDPPLWYLYVLFEVTAIFLILRKLLGEKGLLLGVCLAAFFIRGDNFLYTRKVVFLLPFVAMGWYAWKFKPSLPFNKYNMWLWVPAILLMITQVCCEAAKVAEYDLRPLRYVIAVAGCLAMCGTGEWLQRSKLSKIAVWMGEVSLPVYLLHNIIAEALGLKAQQYVTGIPFLIVAWVICAICIILIGSVHKWLQPRSRVYRVLLLGAR